MDLLAYFRVLRRRWLLILIVTIVGAVLGAASTLVDSTKSAGSSRTYYKATNTLLMSNPSGDKAFQSAFTNLDQVAVLTTTGPVPEAVAKQLGSGESGRQLAEHITTLTNPTSNTLEITAIDADSSRAAQLSDAFADALLANISATDQARYAQANKDASDTLVTLQSKIDTLLGQIGQQPPPANIEVLKAQLQAVENQYTAAYSDFQTVASQQAPKNPFSTLEKAQSVPIGASEYNTRLTQGQLGQNNLQANAQTPVTASAASSDSLSGPVPRGFLGAFLGLLAGAGLALLLERLDRRIRSREDAEAAFGLPVLAEVPELTPAQQRNHEILADTQALSRTAEAYRAVRSALLFHRAATKVGGDGGVLHPTVDAEDQLFEPTSDDPLVIMVTSAAPKEGKTTSSANLAVVFAEAGSRVMVLNCDFRRPMIHQYFGVPDVARRVHRTQIPGVKVVTNVVTEPNANPARVIAMQRQLIAAARENFDVVILDTAPLLSANDAIEVMSEADLVVLVSRANISTVPSAHRAIDILARVDAPVVGTVLGGSDESKNAYYAYYQPTSGDSKLAGRSRRDRGATNGHGSPAPDALVRFDPEDGDAVPR
jgi:Mrp family chromosome partitioning ATPase/capsular polysaccharide biosynthesis protein